MALSNFRVGLFDRLNGDSFGLSDDDKDRATRQGLLGLAAGLLGTGGGFGNALGAGIQSGLLAMNQGADDVVNDRYRQAMMSRTMQGMDRNSQIEAMRGELLTPDGRLDEAKFRQYAAVDPQGAKDFREAINGPQTRWQLGRIGDGTGGEVDVLFDPMDPSKITTIDGQPIGGPLAGAAQQQVPQFGILRDAVEQVESGGDPLAVSPAGAIGPMQTMPGTLRDPGFGVAPARDNSIEEQRRVGNDYLGAMLNKYADPRLALAAYNAGPGRVDQAMAAGGGVDGALSRLPRETQQYVPKVLGRAGVAQAQPMGLGRRPAKAQGEQERYRTLTAEEVAQLGLPSGTVAQQGPTGQIQIVNKPRDMPTAGSGTVIDNGDGTTTYIPAGKVTEGERNAAGFYERMVSANAQMKALEDQGYKPTSAGGIRDQLTAGRAATNWAASPEGQQYQQAAMNWVRANLRKESGAAIGVDEARQEIANYFPQPGDSAEVVKQKADQRRVVEQAMRTAAGGALAPPSQQRADSAKKRLKFNSATGKLE